jgi:ketosteroid isomerase-like protein
MTNTDPAQVAERYFETWKARDFSGFRALLRDDVTFRGPLGTADNADECVAGIRGMSEIVTDIVVLKIFTNGPDVVTWFDLYTKNAPPTPTANWSHVEDGRIARIRVTFDPRPILDHN